MSASQRSRRAGAALVRHPGVDKIAFTGSTPTGQEIMRLAAGTLKKVSLELGGKSPNVIFADADLDAAVKGAVMGIFYGKGEVCTAGSRLFIEEKIHDQFMEKLVERAKSGSTKDPSIPTETEAGEELRPKRPDELETPTIDSEGNAR